jgi:hypothetical protein
MGGWRGGVGRQQSVPLAAVVIARRTSRLVPQRWGPCRIVVTVPGGVEGLRCRHREPTGGRVRDRAPLSAAIGVTAGAAPFLVWAQQVGTSSPPRTEQLAADGIGLEA